MPIDFKKIISGITKQVVTVGGKKGAGLPVAVTLKLDPDFKKTLIKVSAIFATGTALGIGAGIVIAESRKRKR